jgi:hypothetical protein
MQTALNVALKEWSVVCDALLAGRQAILLRKGGIYEAAGEFELEHARFILFPTVLHQKPDSVKPAWRGEIKTVDREPEELTIRGWAEAFWIARVPSRPAFDGLDDLHLWDVPLIDMRFNYRPDYPLYVIVLRSWVLPEPLKIAVDEQYAGCKSWVPLKAPIPTDNSRVVLPDVELRKIKERIEMSFGKITG